MGTSVGEMMNSALKGFRGLLGKTTLTRPLLVASSASVCLAGSLTGGGIRCHGNHSHSDHDRVARLEAQLGKLTQQLQDLNGISQTTGQGEAVFGWDRELTAAFPVDAQPFEKHMHGGFNEDTATGIVYTGIPGYGLCTISPDLKTWKLLGDDERLKGNIHGIVVFKHENETMIAVAQNDDQRVLVVSLDGTVRQQLNMPQGGEFKCDAANHYYSNRQTKQVPWGTPATPEFACTDVTFLDGRVYVVTGYCAGDFVLTASHEGGEWKWGPVAWGGKGDGPGQFNTAHGVFAYDDHIFVANREAHEVLEFTKDGDLIRCLPDIPDGARICNVARADDYFIMNALEPIQHSPARTAQIYAHSGERLLSTIEPGELGIPVLKHLHGVWPHYVTDPQTGERRLYILVHGWSAGKFAVLRHEPEGAPSHVKRWNPVTDRQE